MQSFAIQETKARILTEIASHSGKPISKALLGFYPGLVYVLKCLESNRLIRKVSDTNGYFILRITTAGIISNLVHRGELAPEFYE